MSLRRLACAAIATCSLVAGVLLTPSSAGATTTAPLPVGNVLTGFYEDVVAPNSMPPGTNIWSCKPTAAHPYPVVLVHATMANSAYDWQALSPMLANAGYCVFALDYGGSALGGLFQAIGDIPTSAAQLESFVNLVLSATGAKQVDIVGHSQGGMMPRYYMDFLGGASKVHMFVGLAPSSHGTTADGLAALAQDFQDITGVAPLSAIGCVSCTQQLAGSSFLATLNAGGDTVPGPKYVVIETQYDEVVTPYQSAFLTGPKVQNILLQKQCSLDFTDHIGIPYDPVALQDVMNALGADSPTFKPTCSLVLPILS